MRISVQSAKAKGRRLQQYVRDLLYKLAPELEPGDIVSTSMGAGGEDIRLSPAARKVFPVSIECKAQAKMALYGFYEQAEKNAPKGTEPIVIVRGDRKKPLLIGDAEYLLRKMKNDGTRTN